MKIRTVWWFGTFYIFAYIDNNHPIWLIFFRGVAQPPTREDEILHNQRMNEMGVQITQSIAITMFGVKNIHSLTGNDDAKAIRMLLLKATCRSPELLQTCSAPFYLHFSCRFKQMTPEWVQCCTRTGEAQMNIIINDVIYSKIVTGMCCTMIFGNTYYASWWNNSRCSLLCWFSRHQHKTP